jgi:hypothetical protein
MAKIFYCMIHLFITSVEIRHFGTILDSDIVSHNEEDRAIIDKLKEACGTKINDSHSLEKENPVLQFPVVSVIPEDEYDGIPIFSNAFPWLFPGGIGDINCSKKKENGYVQKWCSTMVHYFDGRFVKDATWCFYALNYLQRHNNNISGGFFVREFIKKNRPLNIDELKHQVTKGDYSFLDKLIYFSSKIRGSDSYWRLKKSQIYSWVYWHIEQGNGPPTLFITLSCAEYYWADIRKLLIERIAISGIDDKKENEQSDKRRIMKAVNQYSIVVQEYFTEKVKDWMETFAKKVLQVTNYFVRFEFAKGRGEIHAHILAIANNKDVFIAAHKAETETEKVEILSKYAQNVLGLTSEIPECQQLQMNTTKKEERLQHFENNPGCKRLSEIKDHNQDTFNLINCSQMHKCGEYCMRSNSNSKLKKNRYCRAGCGYEQTEGMCDTPGFPIQETNIIKLDCKGTKKLLLRRNNKRMIQTSVKVLQSWRSNCDIQLILYESDPTDPNLGELAKVTDYVVSYACKGNSTHEAEKQALLDIVIR